MQSCDGASKRDIIVALAWLLATGWLLLGAAARTLLARVRGARGARPSAAGNPAVTVTSLALMAERGMWRSETVVALHEDAAIAIAHAEDDYRQMLAHCAAAMGAGQPRADEPQPSPDTAPLAA